MFERFSEAARRLIFRALLEARRLHFDAIEPQHLVLGFLDEDQGWGENQFQEAPENREIQSAPVLDAETAGRLKARLSFKGAWIEDRPAVENPPLGKRAKEILALADERADGAMVTPLHFLWAIVDAGDLVAQVLVEHGVTKEMIEKAIVDGQSFHR